jgi:flagellar hook-associated protein 3 FlgL
MNLRVTLQTVTNEALINARQQTDRLGQLQQEASTGNRLLRPSDDPLATVTVLGTKAQDQRLTTYLSNIGDAQQTLNQSVSTLQAVNDLFVQARQVAIEGNSAVNDGTSKEALAQEVDGLLSRLVDLANTQDAGRSLYSGSATTTTPFVVTATDSQGRPQSIAYRGAQQRAEVPISQQQSVATLYTGSEVFQGARQRGSTIYTSNTGAAAGTLGTDSATGQGTLLVQHTTTTYAAGGVQAGTSSLAGDTILGPAGASQLTLHDTSGTGASGTVSLDGGPPVSFTNSDTDLKVTGSHGEVVFVNTTAITPGFNGTSDITANGTLSVDGGASTVPITFNPNQIVTNSTTGLVTNVNSTNIRRTGSDSLDYTGSGDAFQVLMALRDDLRNTHGLTQAQQADALTQRLGELDRVRTGILNVVGEQSASLQNLDALQSRAQDLQLQTRQRTSDLESADITDVVINLQAQQNLLQLTLASASRLLNTNLLNFLP